MLVYELMGNRLYIVTGASGKLGAAFVIYLQQQNQAVVCIARPGRNVECPIVLYADLLSEEQTANALDHIDVSNIDEVIVIHGVGKFKFQYSNGDALDLDGDGMDDEIFSTNVVTLKNVLNHLLNKFAPPLAIKVCAFASVSDKYNIPFWSSYTNAKNILRAYLKELCELKKIDAIVANVSTVDTGNENDLRPNADKTYWLKPEEIVLRTIPELENVTGYKEIEIFKVKPDFDPAYYLNHDAILQKWKREMGT